MAPDSTTTVTVDRISNSGNPIAHETYDGKHILVPSGIKGHSYDVRLIDKGSYAVAELVHEQAGARAPEPAGPSGPGSSEAPKSIQQIGQEMIGEDSLTMEQRECSDNRFAPKEYPGKEHRSEIASRHD